MEIEHLQIRKEEEEKELNNLHKIANDIEETEFFKEDDLKIEFLTRVNKEIEWREVILSELDQSISFKLDSYFYPSEIEAQNEDLIKCKSVNPKK